ncbi:forkhead box protein fkh-2-like [Mytilus trossulus]|uniref:forkhead box protein fkh-2-like n=1 Tax=Mytilus trossulus TaxID=6551 RepID=UPI003007AF7D
MTWFYYENGQCVSNVQMTQTLSLCRKWNKFKVIQALVYQGKDKFVPLNLGIMINSQFSICNLTRGDRRDSISSEGTEVWTPSLCTSENESSNSDSDESTAQLSLDRSIKNILPSSITNKKPSHSYIAMISMAILSKPKKKLLLNDIYQYIMDNFPFYNNKDKAWRNSIRHNLSLNECFMKNGRAVNGKGNYWSIHLACIDDFTKGDFRRRQARQRVRKSTVKAVNDFLNVNNARQKLGYVPMTSSQIGFNPYFVRGFPVRTDFENQYQNLQSPVSALGVIRTSFPVVMQSLRSNSLFPIAPSAAVEQSLSVPSTNYASSSCNPRTYSDFYPSCYTQKGIPDW